MLSNACVYGIQAMVWLAMYNSAGHLTPIAHIAKELHIPFEFLKKVLQKLVAGGLLHSQRSAKGGVALTRKPQEITLFDIVEMIDGTGIFAHCLLKLPGCGQTTPCPIHSAWAIERNRLRRLFEETTLATLAQKTDELDLRLGFDIKND